MDIKGSFLGFKLEICLTKLKQLVKILLANVGKLGDKKADDVILHFCVSPPPRPRPSPLAKILGWSV